MSGVDRDTLDSVLLELDRLCGRLKIWIENVDFKMAIQICEAIISTMEEAELD